MTDNKSPILVFGATGQQGGSVASALLELGWPVRALVRIPASTKAQSLRDAGVEVRHGSFEDKASLKEAMSGVHGVFSVQPSSPGGTVTDEEEVSYGIAVADIAVECGVKHLVYSSGSAVREESSGVAHFDTKSEIEKHIRTLPIKSTIVRPATFMELLTMPGFGLNEGRFEFFMKPAQTMQVIAVEDIGRIIAAVFDDFDKYAGQTFEIAGDTISGSDLEKFFTAAAGRAIPYSRFSDELLASNPFLRKLTAMMDDGRLAGRADFSLMRQLNPRLQTFEAWLGDQGRSSFERALASSKAWDYDK
ncbi:NmrA/HSCARG family protein [Ochrobactrum sp. Q0168]|uniref:NmrA/HSCARG family protein n=1 Tax=Ochrobactrum sp. Q0168 TaxID=2793241 RepID=UPI0018EC297F|nr:NmrA/HSCARG family protein [Ochrobactrum sp. Q0168]